MLIYRLAFGSISMRDPNLLIALHRLPNPNLEMIVQHLLLSTTSDKETTTCKRSSFDSIFDPVPGIPAHGVFPFSNRKAFPDASLKLQCWQQLRAWKFLDGGTPWCVCVCVATTKCDQRREIGQSNATGNTGSTKWHWDGQVHDKVN